MRGLIGVGCIAAIGLVLCVGCATPQTSTQAVPQRTDVRSAAPVAAVTTPPDQPLELRVMSFNIRVKTILDAFGNSWDSRKALLVRTVRDFDPDVLGTQECLASQADYLRQELPDYAFVGVGRDDGRRGGEMCGVFYKRARFDKIGSGFFWLSSTPEKPGSKSWGSSFTRMVTWVKLHPRQGGEDFCVFDTHFDVYGARARLESARLLRQRMQTIAPEMPCIITGDFNDRPGSPAYRTLLASSNGQPLIDTFRAVKSTRPGTDGTRHDFGGGTDGPRIDWIVTNGFETVDAKILHTHQGSKFPSDHFPVAAVLKPATPAQPVARIE